MLRQCGVHMPRRTRVSSPPKRVVVVSDMHCGSTRGLCPPNYRTLDGNPIRLNPVQQWLWTSYTHFVGVARRYAPYALVVNGDAIEGIHHGGQQVWSPDAADHFGAAVQALTPLAEHANAVYIIQGTECHTKSAEHGLVTALPNARACTHRLDLDINGYIVRFVHHISTSSRVYLRASRLSIHLANMQLEAHRAGRPIPSALIAGHCHTYDRYESGGGVLALTMPPWQVGTRFVDRVVPHHEPEVGGVILDFADSARGARPTVREVLYRPTASAPESY